jgi:hypothetical protein
LCIVHWPRHFILDNINGCRREFPHAWSN